MNKYRRYQEEVLECSQKLSANGYFGPASGTGGNVSVLVEGEEAIAVTPSGKVYSQLTPDDICVIRFDGSMVAGEHAPPLARMHLAVYRNRPDVNAVIHTHQPYASVFALINRPIRRCLTRWC